MPVTAPKILTKNLKVTFETDVRAIVTEICLKHSVDFAEIKVKAMRGSRGVFPSIQIIDPSGSAREHHAVATEVKSHGWSPGMLFGFRTSSGTVMSQMFYPDGPDDVPPTIY